MTEYNREEPIFSKLARERSYDLLIGDGQYLSRPKTDLRGPVRMVQGVTTEEALASAGVAAEGILKVMEKVEPKLARVAENVHPKDIIKCEISLEEFTTELVKRFKAKYPGIEDIDLLRKDELDGTVTIVVSERRAPMVQTDEDVNAAPNKTVFVKTLGEALQEQQTIPVMDIFADTSREFMHKYPNAIITGMTPIFNEDGSATMHIDAIEPVSPIAHEDLVKVRNGEMTLAELKEKLEEKRAPEQDTPDSIGENDADALYMKQSSAWGSDEE